MLLRRQRVPDVDTVCSRSFDRHYVDGLQSLTMRSIPRVVDTAYINCHSCYTTK